ncbi:MFS transporter [Nonomuraea sp. NPDC048826]|uniref:MFS transporter n=1 Tax=Nonomuraea sp. NPDC048826 TaxID=3364347 RepID=UPI00371D7F25
MHPPVPLRRRRDYRLLWSARTISITGSEVSRLAVPLTAITLLAASPFQMGLLTAAAAVPALLFGLHAGAIADRLRRHRPLMIACELVSAAAALTVPLAWLLGVLTIPLLIAVALVIGTAAVLFRAVNFPYVAALVPPDQRTAAMAGFNAAYSVASVTGPGLAGVLVQILTAPLTVLVEGISFLVSALLLRSIRTPEHRQPAPSRGLWNDVVEGLRASVSQPVLRALLGAGVTINFFAMAFTAIAMLYMLHTLGIPEGLIGLLTALSGVGGILGAWATTRLAKRYGENRVLLGSVLFFPIEILAMGLLNGPLWWNVTVLALTVTATGGIVVAFASCMSAIIMRETPEELRGRVNATSTFAVHGVLALGALVGGALAEVLGLRTVILLCAAGIATATFWIWASPLRSPSPPDTPSSDGPASPAPDSPASPNQSVAPAESVSPNGSASSGESVTPAGSVSQNQSASSAQSVTSAESASRDQPASPSRPVTPARPTSQGQPASQSGPGTSAGSVSPDQPTSLGESITHARPTSEDRSPSQSGPGASTGFASQDRSVTQSRYAFWSRSGSPGRPADASSPVPLRSSAVHERAITRRQPLV